MSRASSTSAGSISGWPSVPVWSPPRKSLVDQVGEPARDVEQTRLSPRPREGDRRLDQVAGAVELVTLLEIRPAPGRVGDPAPGVQVAVGLLGGLDELDSVGGELLELGRALAPELPRERLEPLVDVRVAEDHAASLALEPSRRDAEVVERPCPFELLVPSEDRHRAVHPLPVAEETARQPHPGRVQRAQPDPRRRRRRDHRNELFLRPLRQTPSRPPSKFREALREALRR